MRCSRLLCEQHTNCCGVLPEMTWWRQASLPQPDNTTTSISASSTPPVFKHNSYGVFTHRCLQTPASIARGQLMILWSFKKLSHVRAAVSQWSSLACCKAASSSCLTAMPGLQHVAMWQAPMHKHTHKQSCVLVYNFLDILWHLGLGAVCALVAACTSM